MGKDDCTKHEALSVSLLACSLVLLGVLLPFSHTRAAQTSMAAITVLLFGLSLWTKRLPLPKLPPSVCVSFGAWLAICLASALWSPWPQRSIETVLNTCVLPALLFVAAASLGKMYFQWALKGGLVGLGLLGVLSISLAFSGRLDILTSGFAADQLGHWLFRWYPGPGLASSFALIGIPLAYMAWRASIWRRFSGCVLAGLLVVGVASFNRMFFVVLFALVVLALWLQTSERAAEKQKLGFGVFIAALLSLFVLTAGIVGSTLLRHDVNADTASALKIAGQKLRGDPRLLIWSTWIAAGAEHVPLGTGFGKEVARRVNAESVASSKAEGLDPAGISHPHNLFISLWVQVGILGLTAFAAMFVTLVRLAWRTRAHAPIAAQALFAITAALLLKNITDDFYDFSLPAMFWMFAGLMLAHSAQEGQPS